ncbi:hypothetical protein [Kitasatospora sp. HPMI-4]|uniref:hypothetical protein n=1 Tax=Kitasatospora sp. HPMI-4 TaxID=3448443 RepID=UPI003F1A42E4
MSYNGPLACSTPGCGRHIEASAPSDGGVREWRCPGCGAFGYTLPPEYAAEHPDEPVFQRVGLLLRPAKKATT